MKKLFLSLAICGFAGLNAQSISDYKYIFVPNDFKDFPANKYKLKSQLVSILKTKNYVIIDQADSLPAELQQNSCSFATAEVENSSSMLRNRVLVKLKDCRNTVVFRKQFFDDFTGCIWIRQTEYDNLTTISYIGYAGCSFKT